MPFTTAITHYVRGDVLEQWLSTTFGSVETGTWSFKVGRIPLVLGRTKRPSLDIWPDFWGFADHDQLTVLAQEIAYGQDGFWQVTAPRVITAVRLTQP